MKSNNRLFNNYMQHAIDAIRSNCNQHESDEKKIEIPVGCVIVDNKSGKILAKSCNKTRKTHNPIQHAEIICINKALKKVKSDRLTDCSMYVTLEPCAMCAGAIALVKLRNLYIGCLSEKTGAVVSNKIFLEKIFNYKPNVYYPIMEKECKTIISFFFKNLKKHSVDRGTDQLM